MRGGIRRTRMRAATITAFFLFLLLALLASLLFQTTDAAEVCPELLSRVIKGVDKNEVLPERLLKDKKPLTHFVVPQNSHLGKGTFGKVFLAFLQGAKKSQADLGAFRSFAIKMMTYRSGVLTKAGFNMAEEVKREIGVQMKLSGLPFVVHTWGSWTHAEADGMTTSYIVMSPAVSNAQKEVLGKGRWFDKPFGREPESASKEYEFVRNVVAQTAIALGAIHERGFAHMDVKAENILLDHRRNVMLADFGRAVPTSFFGEKGAMSHMGDCPVSGPEAALAFMIPNADQEAALPAIKQWMGGWLSFAADYWGLGVTTYKMLKGLENYDPSEVPNGRGLFNAPSIASLKADGCIFGTWFVKRYRQLALQEYALNVARNTKLPLKEIYFRAFKRYFKMATNEFVNIDALRGLPKDAQNFILALLRLDPVHRLGSGGGREVNLADRAKNGWKEVLCHPFLSNPTENVDIWLKLGQTQASFFNEPIVFENNKGAATVPEPVMAKALPKDAVIQDIPATSHSGYEPLVEKFPPKLEKTKDDVVKSGPPVKPWAYAAANKENNKPSGYWWDGAAGKGGGDVLRGSGGDKSTKSAIGSLRGSSSSKSSGDSNRSDGWDDDDGSSGYSPVKPMGSSSSSSRDDDWDSPGNSGSNAGGYYNSGGSSSSGYDQQLPESGGDDDALRGGGSDGYGQASPDKDDLPFDGEPRNSKKEPKKETKKVMSGGDDPLRNGGGSDGYSQQQASGDDDLPFDDDKPKGGTKKETKPKSGSKNPAPPRDDGWDDVGGGGYSQQAPPKDDDWR